MTSIALGLRLYGSRIGRCRTVLENELNSLVSGLEVKIRIDALYGRGWVRIDVEGEDETAAVNQMQRTYGTAPSLLNSLKLPRIVSGHIVDSGKVGYGIYVDIGLLEPTPVDVLVPLHKLRAQLADGEKAPLRRIIETYCLVNDLPISLRLLRVDSKTARLEAEFSDAQIKVFDEWRKDGLDRILALGIPRADAEEAVSKVGLRRDVAGIESLGSFEQCFICKFGTQAPGIIGRLGKGLPGVPLYIVHTNRLWLMPTRTEL